MSQDIPGLTHCPDCETELATTDIQGDKPVQLVTRLCQPCNELYDMHIVWFPDETRIVCGDTPDPGVECDECRSTDSAYTFSRSDEELPIRRCADHLPSYLASEVTLPQSEPP